MSFYSKGTWLSSKRLDSKVTSANVQNSERWIGYFVGPAGIVLLNAIMSSYLNVFYTDVLKIGALWSGMFLVIFPIVSKVLDAFTNIIMGQLIDKTKSRQGKARPWLFIAGPAVALSAVLLFLVPHASTTVQVIWIVFTYNLYYSIAYTIYYMSHSMLVPLSTRNAKQRDGVAMLQNMAICIIPGMFVALFFPMLIIPKLGVDQTKWIMMIAIFAIISLPCVLLEYYFTKERITEESNGLANEENVISMKDQFKACFSSKYWIIIMLVQIIIQICMFVQNTSLIYYCNWVLGTYNDGITQTIVSAVGNAPLGFGILIMWSLVSKFGKRNVMLVGLVVGIIGSIMFVLNPANMGSVIVALMIRSFGVLPLTYIVMAMFAEALDHVEWKAGFRCDGLSMSIYTVICTVAMGLGTGIFNLGLSVFSYVPPAADGTWIEQTQMVKNYFVFGYMGLYGIGLGILFVLFLFYKVEKEMPVIQKDIIARHKAEAAAQGKEWFSAEELAEKEQMELDRVAEENRIRELKDRCAKKGLNFDEEEEKYQLKLAKQKAKKEAKKHKQKTVNMNKR